MVAAVVVDHQSSYHHHCHLCRLCNMKAIVVAYLICDCCPHMLHDMIVG
jgi:hypothetical protein